VACTQKNVYSNISSNIEEIDVTKYANINFWNPTKYEYDGYVVKLETTDECLIPYITNVFFSENRIFVKTNTPQVFIFDNEGNFINKLKLGNGPGEIARLIDACYDAEKNELVVYQDPYIKYYTPNGEFKYEKEIPYFFLKICSIKQGYLLKSPIGHMQYVPMPNARLIFVDKNFESPKAFLNEQINNPTNSSKALCYNKKNDITIIPTNSDTIYYFNNNVLTPIYYIHYTKNTDITSKDMFLFSEDYLETSEHQYFGFINKGFLNLFRDKKTGNIIAGRFEDAENATFVTSPIAVYNDYFVCVKTEPTEDIIYEKSDLFSLDDLAKINNQKEDDNPLLIFFKLKPFEDEE